MLHLSASGPSRMVFEHLRNNFHLEDLASGFPQLFQLCFHITQGHNPPQITRVLGAAYLLAMTKPLGGISPIAVGETLYRLISRALCLQFHETFTTHFPPHQFGVVIKGGYETIFHNIKCNLDLHLDWVVLELDLRNAFNSMSKKVIFKELYATSGGII
jgi:hypothetical protein